MRVRTVMTMQAWERHADVHSMYYYIEQRRYAQAATIAIRSARQHPRSKTYAELCLKFYQTVVDSINVADDLRYTRCLQALLAVDYAQA